jgi:tetratricopeptide (TPR) repeat protein
MIIPRPPEKSPTLKGKRAVYAICAGLTAAVLLIFGQTLRNGFVNFDDDIYVYANPHVVHGFTPAGIIWAFTSCRPTGNWHPLTWLSHMLDCQLYGLDAGYQHLTDVLLHAANAILLFLVLRQMTGTLWRSAMVAAIFAVHPLRVESVAWISERKDTLSGFFFMLTLLMYARYALEKPDVSAPRRPLNYALMLLFFLLGLMSKPMLVTLPFVLLLLDYWPLHRFTFPSPPAIFRRLLIEKSPFFLLAAVASVVTFFTQKTAGAVAAPALGLRLENALVCHAAYLGKLFWPEHLAVLYPYPLAVPWWPAAAGGVLLAGGTVAVILLARRCPWLLTGWLWHLGMLVPVIGIVQAGGQAMADRFTYLPQIGLAVALVWGIYELAAAARIPKLLLGSAAAIATASLMACSFHQISYWRDSESLWTHTLACTPANPIAQIDFGLALEAAGRRDEAIEHYQQALKIRPDRPFAWNCLGLALAEQGRGNEAVACFNQAIQFQPDDAAAYSNWGATLVKQGRSKEAITPDRKAVALQPDNLTACFDLAKLLASQNQFTEAAQFYEAALRLQPDYAEAHNNLANVLAAQNRPADAIEHYQAAIRLKPDYAEAHYNFAVVLAAQARLEESADQFRRVIQLHPENPDAHGNLANVLMGQGQLDNAIAQYQQTIQLAPHSDQARFKLGLALEKKGRRADAIEQFQQTLRLNSNRPDAQAQLRNLGAVAQ